MRRLRIFISSPGDGQKERQIAERVVGRLTAEFADHVALDPYFWEYEPMRITADFQAQIAPPSDFDIVVCILWSALDPETQSIRGAFTAYTNLAEFEERLEQHLRKLIVARAGEHAHDEGTAAPLYFWLATRAACAEEMPSRGESNRYSLSQQTL
jgi:hypothetical protein